MAETGSHASLDRFGVGIVCGVGMYLTAAVTSGT
jgi:uncharacterized membrane protein YhiD involved in acid resistance